MKILVQLVYALIKEQIRNTHYELMYSQIQDKNKL